MKNKDSFFEKNIWINKHVVHSLLGEGVVTDLKNKKISVFFPAQESEKQHGIFRVPATFAKGLLSTEDIFLSDMISDYLRTHSCEICGDTNAQTVVVGETRVCLSCRTERAEMCYLCKRLYDKTKKVALHVPRVYYHTKEKICPKCAEIKTFLCDECQNILLINDEEPINWLNRQLCSECFNHKAHKCYFCGAIFAADEGIRKYDYDSDEYINICPNCIASHTFQCSSCSDVVLENRRVISKYISASDHVCSHCAVCCDSCNERLLSDNAHLHLNKYYCPDCWSGNSVECPVCGDQFVAKSKNEFLCPDCKNAEDYEQRIQALSLQNVPYKQISYYALAHMDRCALFTELYECCRDIHRRQTNQSEPFNYIAMHFMGKVVVITYLNHGVFENHKYARNVTMTEFRSTKGRMSVNAAVDRWLPVSEKFMETSAGRMQILKYPVLLRVQTEYDKIYGKEWNGPYDYTEIGNYGDTTDFYIIGVLNPD